jgi:hypothetical protein
VTLNPNRRPESILKFQSSLALIVEDRRSLDIGCRWWHISNANLGVRNPEFNGFQIILGYHWFKSWASGRAQ